MRIDDPGANNPRPVVLGCVDPERLVLREITARAYHSDCCATRTVPGYMTPWLVDSTLPDFPVPAQRTGVL